MQTFLLIRASERGEKGPKGMGWGWGWAGYGIFAVFNKVLVKFQRFQQSWTVLQVPEAKLHEY